MREDTIVVFQSDHGHSVEVRAHSGGGWAGPYRGHKGTLLEGGIRVPAIVSWPGHLPEGETRDQLGVTMDWYPTLAELCGLDLSKVDRAALPAGVDGPANAKTLDGRSLAAVLRDGSAASPHQFLHWNYGGRWVVRDERYKLLCAKDAKKAPKAQPFLVDLRADPGETTDVSASQPQVLQRLLARHERSMALDVR